MGKRKTSSALASAAFGVIGLVTFAERAQAGSSITWNGATSQTFGFANNWIGGVAPGSADVAVFPAIASVFRTPFFDGADTVAGFVIDNSGGLVWTLPRNGGSNPRSISIGSLGISLSGGSTTTWGAITTTIATDQTWNVASGTTLSFSSSALLGGSGKLTLQGGGELDFSNGGSGNTGTVDLKGGTLVNIRSADGYGTGVLEVFNGGTYTVAAANVASRNAITLFNGGAVHGLGASVGIGTTTVGTSFNIDTTPNTTVSFVGGTTVTDSFSIVPPTLGGDATDQINITGTGAVVLANGTNAATSYVGKWKVFSGSTLRPLTVDSLGNRNGALLTGTPSISFAIANPIELAGGTLSLAGQTSSGASAQFNNAVNVTADSTMLIDKNGSGSVVVNGTLQTRGLGAVTIGTNTLNISAASNVTSASTVGGTAAIGFGTLVLQGNATFNVLIPGTFNGGIELTLQNLAPTSSTYLLTKDGPGALGGGTANTSFTNDILIKQGSIRYGNLNCWGTSNITTAPNTTVNFAGGRTSWTTGNSYTGYARMLVEGGSTATLTIQGGNLTPGTIGGSGSVMTINGKVLLAKTAGNALGNLNLDLLGNGSVAGTDFDQLLISPLTTQTTANLGGLANYNLNLAMPGTLSISGAATFDIVSLTSGTISAGNFANPAVANAASTAGGTARFGIAGSNGLASILETFDSANGRVRLSNFLGDNQYSGNSGGNWTTASAANWTVFDPNSNLFAAKFADSAGFTGAGTVNVDNSRTVMGVVFNSTARQYTLNQTNGSVLTLDNTLNGGAATMSAVGQHVVNVPIALSSNFVAAVTSSTDSLTLGSSVTGTGKTLTKTGAGALILAGSSGYSGLTTISGGTLQVGAGTTSGQLAAGGVANSAVLAIKHSDTYNLNTSITGVGSLVQSGSGTTVLGGTGSYSGATNVTAGVLDLTGILSSSASLTVDASAAAAHLILDHATAIPSSAAVVGVGTSTLPVVDVYFSQNFASLNSTGSTAFNAGSSTISSIGGIGTITVASGATLTAMNALNHGGLSNAGAVAVSGGVSTIGSIDGVGSLTVSSSASLTASTLLNQGVLANAGTVSINGGPSSIATISGAGALVVGSAATVNVSSSLMQSSINSNGSINLNGGAANAVTTIDGSGTLAVTGANLTANYIRHGGLSVGPGSTVTIAHDDAFFSGGMPTHTSVVTTLAVDAAGTLDLTNNGLVVLDTTQFGAIQSAVTNAADGHLWDKPGITSSTAAVNNSDHAVGYALASSLPNGGSTSFNGISFTDAVLVRYTLIGDSNLKGSVDLSDYSKVVQNFGKPDAVWADGNFDYSGTVGLGDYTKVVQAFGRTDSAALNNTDGPSARQVRAASSALTLKAAAAAPSVINATDVTLTVNLATGNVTLISAVQSPTAVITAYTVKSPSGSLIKFKNSATKYLGVSFENNPNVFYTSSNSNQYHNWTGIKNTTTVIGEGFGNSYTATNDTTWTNYTLPSNGYALGKMFLQLTSGGVADLSFQWDDASLNTYTSVVNYVGGAVPEPTSVSLLAMGAIGLLGRRRRSSR